MTMLTASGRNLEDCSMVEQGGGPGRIEKSASASISRPKVIPPILTLAEVARYLRVHPSTVYRLLKSNQLPAFRVGKDWRFRLEDIDKFCLGVGETTSK